MSTSIPANSAESLRLTPESPMAAGTSDAFEIPAPIQRSHEGFRSALPELLKNQTESQQWVAFHGAELVAFGRTKTEAYQECLRRGLARGTFVVRRIEPGSPPNAAPAGAENATVSTARQAAERTLAHITDASHYPRSDCLCVAGSQ